MTIAIQAPQNAHTRIIISILYTCFIHQAACGERRFSRTLVQAPVIWIPSSYHVRKGNEVPLWLRRIQRRVTGFHLLPLAYLKAIFFGNFHLCSGVPITITTPNHTHAVLHALFSYMLPHHVLSAGAVKPATLYSGFIQHQSSSLLFFRRYYFKTMFYFVLRTELSAVCLYGLYRELDTLLLFYYYILLLTHVCICKNSIYAKQFSQSVFISFLYSNTGDNTFIIYPLHIVTLLLTMLFHYLTSNVLFTLKHTLHWKIWTAPPNVLLIITSPNLLPAILTSKDSNH